jgi:PD-(D/E)XK nuclease superfamily
MTIPRTGAYIWVTWLAKLMSGDHSCEWAPWFKTHYQGHTKVDGGFDSASWKVRHTRLLRETRIARQRAGETLLVESQTAFRLSLADPRLVLAGQADLVSLSGSRPTIIDVKTGQPRAADELQVMIYMWALPQGSGDLAGSSPEGLVVYEDHQVPIAATRIDDRFRDDLGYFLRLLASDEPAHRVPSWPNCRFCDIGSDDCSSRVETAAGGEYG